MYAKLVVGGTALIAHEAMRDIGRLITSENPSVSLLGAFSQTSSLIMDPTPAGWSYVGGANVADQPNIAAIGSNPAYVLNTYWNLAFSAPCLESTKLKYAILTLAWQGAATNANRLFTLTAAESVSATGVAVNEGPRYTYTSSATSTVGAVGSIRVAAGDILHVIANPRALIIINENRGISSVLEASVTDVNRLHNLPPVIQYCHAQADEGTRATNIIPVVATTATTGKFSAAAIGVIDANNGVYYGTYDVTVGGTRNLGNYFNNAGTLRANSVTAYGTPLYQVTPLYFQLGALGYPTQYVTGTVPIYLTAPDIGATGDTVNINGDSYTFFNLGTAIFGVAIKYD